MRHESALIGVALTTQGLNDRVRHVGMVLEIDTLSPHDCRNYWVTRASENSFTSSGRPADTITPAP